MEPGTFDRYSHRRECLVLPLVSRPYVWAWGNLTKIASFTLMWAIALAILYGKGVRRIDLITWTLLTLDSSYNGVELSMLLVGLCRSSPGVALSCSSGKLLGPFHIPHNAN